MTRRVTRALAITAIAAASMLALPAAANASTIYPPSDSCAVSSATMVAGEPFDFACNASTFSANETVTITITGENGAGATFGAAFVKFAISTGSTTRTSTATGSLEPVEITLPADASGVYNIAAISATSAGGAGSTTIAASGGGLPVTGGDGSGMMGLWLGGGALLLGGTAIAAAAAARRARAQH
ncbi:MULTISPECIES: cell wall protein [unclassified Microbacterium]|uniref:cell wall protein n=1 Tax=unclassified Microbacterium TaxID=2609290 RepID=UPI00214B8DA0|nr:MULTISPECIES: cell wall protein [unclassified Microbacterium]MCR2784946.1 cell wall protein [Microbacterium sp. zg.B96]WIM16485.1 cell wall protein [Microbacterium sp. zg-B96]